MLSRASASEVGKTTDLFDAHDAAVPRWASMASFPAAIAISSLMMGVTPTPALADPVEATVARILAETVNEATYATQTVVTQDVDAPPQAPALTADIAEESSGYSIKSYYTVLGLFVISVPGLWSLVKRAPTPKPIRKTFVAPGPAVANAPPTSAIARDIALHYKNLNFKIKDASDVITFEGAFAPSVGQAAYVTSCAALGLASTALVLTIQFPALGNAWYLMCLFSPFAGQYYWENAERVETVRVKLVTSDDDATTDIVLEASKDEIERFGEELPYNMKGMKRVRGVFDNQAKKEKAEA